MSLMYKGQLLHDAGCSCCSLKFSDAALSSVDPTGTRTIRRAMSSAMVIKLNSLRPLLRTQIVTNDILGLNLKSVMSSMIAAQMTAGGASKVDMFQRMFDNLVQNTVLENSGEYLKPYIAAAYAKGEAFGRSEVPQELAGIFHPLANQERINTLHKFTFIELQGVAEALSQQVVRAVANGLLTQQAPNKILRAIFGRIDAIGLVRAKTIAEFMVVRTFNEAAMDVYELAGISQVNLVPETRPSPGLTTDARKQRRVTGRGGGAGSRVSRTQTPSPTTIRRIEQQEARLNRLKLVRVRTAGDDDVCPICEDIADDGPYTINEARSLIPAHPRCRCTIVPARDARFASDKLLNRDAKPGDLYVSGQLIGTAARIQVKGADGVWRDP